MTSIERTGVSQFKRLTWARVRHVYCLDKPPGPSRTLDKPAICRAVYSFEQLR